MPIYDLTTVGTFHPIGQVYDQTAAATLREIDKIYDQTNANTFRELLFKSTVTVKDLCNWDAWQKHNHVEPGLERDGTELDPGYALWHKTPSNGYNEHGSISQTVPDVVYGDKYYVHVSGGCHGDSRGILVTRMLGTQWQTEREDAVMNRSEIIIATEDTLAAWFGGNPYESYVRLFQCDVISLKQVFGDNYGGLTDDQMLETCRAQCNGRSGEYEIRVDY